MSVYSRTHFNVMHDITSIQHEILLTLTFLHLNILDSYKNKYPLINITITGVDSGIYEIVLYVERRISKIKYKIL